MTATVERWSNGLVDLAAVDTGDSCSVAASRSNTKKPMQNQRNRLPLMPDTLGTFGTLCSENCCLCLLNNRDDHSKCCIDDP
jgi:hypothetical protein